MEGSSMDESSSTTDSNPKIVPHFPATVAGKSSPGSLCRMGSGTSVLIDSDTNGIEAESRKLPSSKYKGVVPQPNGRWGAQIYEKHQRVWLGTFNEEHQAARSYDVAAQRFRGRDAVTNFKPLSPENDAAEIRFITSRSKSEIVDMLRKHTYHDELQQSKRNFKLKTSSPDSSQIKLLKSDIINDVVGREQLFEKVVTPSDVGKLNRLVIPKQHAEKYFPINGGGGGGGAAACSTTKGVLLNFEDVNEKVWRFRYSYWNSSQSYVLTKGWSRFVKEKGLKAGDVISFQRSNGPDRQLYIDWKPRNNSIGLGLGPGPEEGPVGLQPGRILRLFGVDICKVAAEAAGSGKRLREVELLAMESSSKKQMVVVAAL